MKQYCACFSMVVTDSSISPGPSQMQEKTCDWKNGLINQSMSLIQTEGDLGDKKTDCAKANPFESFASMGRQWLAWPYIADRHSGKSFDEEASLFASRSARCRPIYPATKIIGQISSILLLLVQIKDTNRTRPVLFEILT